MRTIEVVGIVVGFVLAIVVAVGVSQTATGEIEDGAELAQTIVESVPTVAPTTATPATAPVIGVEGLPSSVGDVLGAEGFTEMLSRTDLEQQLPPSVVALLIERDAVLRIAEAAAGSAP